MKNLFLITLIVLASTANAQISDIPPSIIDRKDLLKLNRTLKFDHKNIERLENDEVCTISVGVRFYIKSTGEVANISCSKNASVSMKAEIIKFLLSSNGLWLPRKLNGVAVDSKPFFIIYAIAFEGAKPTEKLGYPDSKYLDAFDFGNDEASYPFDCILLPPMFFLPPMR